MHDYQDKTRFKIIFFCHSKTSQLDVCTIHELYKMLMCLPDKAVKLLSVHLLKLIKSKFRKYRHPVRLIREQEAHSFEYGGVQFFF